jgi:hypothetical protein
MNNRSGEKAKSWFRSERYYHVSGQWYFTTREAMELGPFPSRQDAEAELMLFVRHINSNALPGNAFIAQ